MTGMSGARARLGSRIQPRPIVGEDNQMEQLKPKDELLLPDIRNRNRVNLDHSTGVVTEMTCYTIYDEVSKITLRGGAPSNVRSHFETARNLLVYSWFVYTFNIAAIMQALASLEMAVREKTGEKKTPFKTLLDKVFKNRQLFNPLGPALPLSIAISKARNDLAHGSPTLHGMGLPWVTTCAELINELYP